MFPSPSNRDAEYFRGLRHAGANRRLIDFQSVGLFTDQFANLVGELKNLEHAEPAAIACTTAAFATAGRLNSFAARKTARAHPGVVGKIGSGELFWYFAAIAELAKKPLGDDCSQGGAQQISLDAEIEQPRHRGGGRFGVKCRQTEMTG